MRKSFWAFTSFRYYKSRSKDDYVYMRLEKLHSFYSSSACSMSAMMSAASSIPADILTKPAMIKNPNARKHCKNHSRYGKSKMMMKKSSMK